MDQGTGQNGHECRKLGTERIYVDACCIATKANAGVEKNGDAGAWGLKEQPPPPSLREERKSYLYGGNEIDVFLVTW